MKHIKDQLQIFAPVKKTRRTERGDLLDFFWAELNIERKRDGKKEYAKPYIAVRISHIPTKDLYYLKRICEDALDRHYSFGKCFFGSLKVKHGPPTQQSFGLPKSTTR